MGLRGWGGLLPAFVLVCPASTFLLCRTTPLPLRSLSSLRWKVGQASSLPQRNKVCRSPTRSPPFHLSWKQNFSHKPAISVFMNSAKQEDAESHGAAVADFMTEAAQDFCAKTPAVEVVLDVPDQWWGDVVAPRLERIADECGLSPDSRVLDVGTGTGAMIASLAGNGRAEQANVVGLDFCESMLEEAGKRFPAAMMVKGDITTIALDSLAEEDSVPEFDVVVFNAVFSTVFDQAAALENAAKLLKRGGKIVISHPLGAQFVEGLREQDSSLLVHPLPSKEDLQRLVYHAPLQVSQVVDEEELYIASLVHTPCARLKRILCMRGEVATGYGRGGKKLGVPTANLPESQFASALAEVPVGVYCGWASLPSRAGPFKAVVNVGYSPTFVGEENREKIVEAHLLGEVGADFYGEEMRLILAGFQRPEKKFPSFPALLAAIKQDIEDARTGLDEELLAALCRHPFLQQKAWRQPHKSEQDLSFREQGFMEAQSECR